MIVPYGACTKLEPNQLRFREIYMLHNGGMSYARIAKLFGLTPHRISQICHKVGRTEEHKRKVAAVLDRVYVTLDD